MSKKQQNHGHSIFDYWNYSIVVYAQYRRKPSEDWRDAKADQQQTPTQTLNMQPFNVCVDFKGRRHQNIIYNGRVYEPF